MGRLLFRRYEMEKVIKIGDKEVKLKSSAATYWKYRKVFTEDLFRTLQDMTKDLGDDGTIPDGAVAVLLQAAYIMAGQADPKMNMDIETWLDQFELMDSINGIQGVFEMLMNDQVTIDEAKKKNDQLSE